MLYFINDLFQLNFSDPAETPVKIGLEGVERICEDLELDPVIFHFLNFKIKLF